MISAFRRWGFPLLLAVVGMGGCGDNRTGIDPGEPDAAPIGPACDDGVDNDGDGKIDFPNDPGCVIAQSDDETDSCPSGADCPQCGNGIDDNNDGLVDYPEDPGCSSAADNSEFRDDPNACGVGLKIKALPASGTDLGMLDNLSTSMIATTCGGGAGASAVAYLFHLAAPKVMVASTNLPGTVTDTVLDLRGVACSDPASEIACNDNVGTAQGSTLTQSLAAGSYYLIVGAKAVTDVGAYELQVQFFAGEGSTCTAQPDCGPGLVCRIPVGSTQMICAQPVCNDTIDDDGDGKIDFPADPGCVDPADDSETDDCPSGPNCPACGDGVDNDGDGFTDYPADTSCASASATSEACAGELDPIAAITSPSTMSTLVGTTDEHDPSCGGAGGPDRLFTLQVPALETLVIDTNGSVLDTVLSLLDTTCAEPSIECDDDDGVGTQSLISRTNVPAGVYVIAVDAYSSSTTLGTIIVNVSGTVAPGTSCEGALFASGALDCSAAHACTGAVGARTCTPAQCSDGVDNNADGRTDYPADPSCGSPDDNTEEDVCPGAMCPVCSDGIDNDGDGFTDYPADDGCLAASSDDEAVSCPGELDPVIPITAASTMGTLVGTTDEHDPSCGSNGGVDRIYALSIPSLVSLVIDTEGSVVDTVLSLMSSACTEPSLACDDDGGVSSGSSLITRTQVPAGVYTVAVDAYSSSTTAGTFNLNVSGVVAPNQSCEGVLFQAGALTCSPGFACRGAVGARTCAPSACNDGIDNNLDGTIDFPFDPGCSSASDDVEDDVCPGASCPVCSNLSDDDTDGATDFPMDFGCASAGGTTEAFCAVETTPGTLITMPQTAGTLAAPATDDYDQPCQSSTGNDLAYALQLPVPVQTLVISTEGSTISDTVLSLWDANCGASLGCDDDAGTGFLSLLTLSNVAAGGYAVQVDSFSTSNNGAFLLNVRGTVAAGTACTHALFTSGVLVCPMGTTCNGAVCQ